MFDASRQSFLTSALLCLPMAGLFVARFLVHPLPAETPFTEGMPLSAALAEFSVFHPILAAVLGAFIVGWTMLIVVKLALKYAPAGSRNYLTAHIFLIGAAGILVPGETLGASLCGWLLALATRQGVLSFHKGYRFAEVFRLGLYMGVIPLLYAPAAAMAVICTVACLMIFKRSGREAIVCFTGLLLPVPMAGFIHLAMGEAPGFIYNELWRCTTADTSGMFAGLIPVSGAVVAGLVLLMAFIGAGWALTHKRGMRKTPSKFVQYVSLVLVLLIASTAIPGTSPTLIPLLATASALAAPCAFSGKWTVVSSILYYVIVITIFAINCSPFVGFIAP